MSSKRYPEEFKIEAVKQVTEQGIDGLSSQSKRPLKSPNTKINAELEALILEMRSARNLGARRLQTELMRRIICAM